ncbi:hypothetical protein JYQ62_00225 [Nostoc sp. UHCC 0702]|nr:hypothetical protein JYQ62_00225 [Nostoc sp. UHCC 0702]
MSLQILLQNRGAGGQGSGGAGERGSRGAGERGSRFEAFIYNKNGAICRRDSLQVR